MDYFNKQIIDNSLECQSRHETSSSMWLMRNNASIETDGAFRIPVTLEMSNNYYNNDQPSFVTQFSASSPSTINGGDLKSYRYNAKSHRSLYRKNRNYQRKLAERQAANIRERRRMQSINEAFEGLRCHIPTMPYEKRLSKVDTLRLAISYIGFLQELIKSDCGALEPIDCSGNAIRSTECSIEQKIILSLKHHSSKDFRADLICGHSLSWRNDREPTNIFKRTFKAEIWTPEVVLLKGMNQDCLFTNRNNRRIK